MGRALSAQSHRWIRCDCPGPYPTAFIRIDPAIGSTGAAAIDAMLAGDPPVAIMDFDDPQVVRVDVRLLSDPETEHVAARLRHVLAARG